MRFLAQVVLIVGLVVGIGCGDGLTDPSTALIQVVEGGGGSDTILALSPNPLVVEVRDGLQRPIPGIVVQFFAMPTIPGDDLAPRRPMYVCSTEEPACAYFAGQNYSVIFGTSDTTDGAGRAEVRVQFGVVAGPASIRVSVPARAISTEISFTTRPGALAEVVASVPDTAVYVGGGYSLGAHAADRFGNVRTDPVRVTSMTPGVVDVASGNVSAVSVGRGRILMEAGSVVDTAYVSVPPPGRLAVFGRTPDPTARNALVLVNTDGSERRVILLTTGDNGDALPVWSPTGNEIVFEEVGGSQYRGQLHVTDTLGNARVLLTNAPDFPLSIHPSFSAGEGALYFFGLQESTGLSGIYRANRDGTGSTFLVAAFQPAPSPDGARLAYSNGDSLLVWDVATQQASSIAANPQFPRWSPAADLIAFASSSGDGVVRLVRADGSGQRTLGAGFGDRPVSWSPDGQWLVVAGPLGGLELIRIVDGERLPIHATLDMRQPSWRP